MTVVGVLVETEVGDQHELVAERSRAARASASWTMPVGVRGARARRRPWPRARRRARGPGHRERRAASPRATSEETGVLNDARQRRDRLGLGYPLTHEQRRDEIARRRGLVSATSAPQRRRCAAGGASDARERSRPLRRSPSPILRRPVAAPPPPGEERRDHRLGGAPLRLHRRRCRARRGGRSSSVRWRRRLFRGQARQPMPGSCRPPRGRRT